MPTWTKSVREEVLKRGREYDGCGEEYNVAKMERGSNIIFPIMLRLFGKISRWNGMEILEKKLNI